jgi:beta-phosphoglucomutase
VLADTQRIVIEGWQKFAAQHGRTFSDEEIIQRFFGRRTVDILVEVFGIAPGQASVLAAQGMDDKRAEVAAGAPLGPVRGAPEFVRATIAAGISCALVSSASEGNIELALEHIGLVGAFPVVVGHDHVERGKPAPDPYLAGAAALGVDPRDCIVFEDTAPGIAAAHSAGALCVGVASLGRPELVQAADLVIADFVGLAPTDVISRLGGHARRAARPGARYRDMSTAAAEAERQS